MIMSTFQIRVNQILEFLRQKLKFMKAQNSITVKSGFKCNSPEIMIWKNDNSRKNLRQEIDFTTKIEEIFVL